ncbi:hypothetical protein EXIGLDRAFT_70893 [Exidia glandulosa HHB12029]|uniref:Uncharacterized protein n=1 Tax=Exidia glandulosa HHB12029 TaxID=1314781 RepID=A0A166AJY4_EXIGL|nr:hypothetical protein EXIGLDRAFT_70893 [Exidia glandulosa HHB12029]
MQGGGWLGWNGNGGLSSGGKSWGGSLQGPGASTPTFALSFPSVGMEAPKRLPSDVGVSSTHRPTRKSAKDSKSSFPDDIDDGAGPSNIPEETASSRPARRKIVVNDPPCEGCVSHGTRCLRQACDTDGKQVCRSCKEAKSACSLRQRKRRRVSSDAATTSKTT